MKRILISVLAVFFATSAVWAQNDSPKPAKASSAPVDCSTTTDSQITDNVKARLAATPSLKGQAIEVATSAGVVTLTGKVKTSSSKGVATRITKSVECVKKVDNKCEAETKSVPPKRTNKNAKPKSSM
jgi:osmotically-inducible protein OsmY